MGEPWWYWLAFSICVLVVFVVGCVLLEKKDDETFREFITAWPGRW